MLAKHRKDDGTAYALWFFLGALGAHRYYLRDYGHGAACTGVWCGWLLAWSQSLTFDLTPLATTMWWVLGFGMAVLWLADLFMIPGAVRSYNNDLARTLAVQIQAGVPLA